VDAFEADGHWWLPESPDHTVPGRLSVSDQGIANLALIGALESGASSETIVQEDGSTVTVTEPRLDRRGVYPRILGHAGSSGYTLEDCLQTRRTLGGIDTEEIRASQVFKDVHFGADEALEFTEIRAWMDWLVHWTAQTGLEEEYTSESSKDLGDDPILATLSIRFIKSQTCAGGNGVTVTLGQSYGIEGDGITERRLMQDFHFRITAPGLVSLDQLLQPLSDLQDLVSIGTGRTAAYKSIELRHPNVVHTFSDRAIPVTIKMFAGWQVKSEESGSNLYAAQMFFTFDELGGMQGVERWLAVAGAHRSALGRVMATRYSPGMYVSDRLLNCAAALEAYDRDLHGKADTYYIDRLRRLAGLAGDTFRDLVGDVEVWVTAFKDARNDVAHHKARMVTVSTEHLFLSRSGYWLFVLCLLRETSAPEAVFSRIAKHSGYGRLKSRIAELLLPSALVLRN